MSKRSKADLDPAGSIEIMAVGPDGELLAVEVVPIDAGDLIAEVAAPVVPAARAAGPAKFGVEFGIRVRRDGSVALADDAGKAMMRVFLEWHG